MSSVRVEALDLKLRAPGAMRPAGDILKARAEGRFMPAVLTAMGRRLGRIYGEHAVVRIRRLKIRCGMRPSELEEEQFAEMIGEDLAAYVEQLVQSERGSGRLPSATAAAQVYRDTAHLEAAELIAAAGSSAGPSGTRQDFARLWSRLARAKPAHVETVLARCLEAGKLEPVLARLDAPALAALAPIVARSRVTGLAAAVARARAAHAPASPGKGAKSTGETPVTGSDDAARPRKRTRRKESAARRAGEVAPPAAEGKAVREPFDEAPADPPRKPARRKPPTRRRNVARPASHAAFEFDAEAPRQPKKMPPDVGAPEPPALAPQIDEPEMPDAEPEADACHESGWCALLYLLNVSQRLELPERLWQIGVDEGAVLAAAFARLAGDDEDPAPRLLSAAFPDAPPPVAPLPDWARDEIRTGVLDAAARLLGAPVEPLRARVADLDAFYSPGPEFDLVGWCAACHLAVAEAMLGQALAPGAIGEHFARPGRIEIETERYRVIQPLAAIDVDLRRLGLDADPGFLPWLGRKLLFVFEGDEA